MSNASTERLLLAERQFSELAEQLSKLKSAAQTIEQAGKATGEMRELAESAIRTADELGHKIHATAEILQKHNLPQHLREGEERQNTKFSKLMNQVANLELECEEATSQIVASQKQLQVLVEAQKIHSEKLSSAISQTEASLKAVIAETQQIHSNKLSFAISQADASLKAAIAGLASDLRKQADEAATISAKTDAQFAMLTRVLAVSIFLQLGSAAALFFLLAKR